MSEIVEFPANGDTASGYLATPPAGIGPGLILVQEWWGVDPSLKQVADRLAEAGFVVLTPDLFHGEVASHQEMDKAAELMAALPASRAARDMSAAVDFLAGLSSTSVNEIGVVGFCMGGKLALLLAADRPDRVGAAVSFYGYPSGDDEPDWSAMTAAVRGHMAGSDTMFPPAGARVLEERLKALGKDAQITVHEGVGHAFMGPHNALGTLNEELAARIWPKVIDFLHQRLGE